MSDANELALRLKSGDISVLADLAEACHSQLSYATTRHFRACRGTEEWCDIYQEACLTLIDMCRYWKPDGGAAFTSFLHSYLDGHLRNRFTRQKTHEDVSVAGLYLEGAGSTETSAVCAQVVASMATRLGPDTANLLMAHVLGTPVSELAAERGLTTVRIRQKLSAAQTAMRKSFG